MKLPKYKIDYKDILDTTKLPFNGDKVLLHINAGDMPPFDGSIRGEYQVELLDGYFYVDGEESHWRACIDDCHDLSLGLSPDYWSPLPEFEEVQE